MTKYWLCLWILLSVTATYAGDARTWRWVGPGKKDVTALVPLREATTVWFAIDNGGLFKSMNVSAGWLPTGLNEVSKVIPFFGGILLTRGKGPNVQLLESTDSGDTDHVRANIDLEVAQNLTINPSDPLSLFSYTYSEGFVISTDGGSHWNKGTDPYVRGQKLEIAGCTVEYWSSDSFIASPFERMTVYGAARISAVCEDGSRTKFNQLVKGGVAGWRPLLTSKEEDFILYAEPGTTNATLCVCKWKSFELCLSVEF